MEKSNPLNDASSSERATSAPPTADEDTTRTPSMDKTNEEITKTGDEEKKDAEDGEPEPEYPHGMRLVTIMASMVICMFLSSLDQTIVATAIPRITDEFHGLGVVSWYGSAYFMTFAGFLPSWGKAMQSMNIKYTFLAGLFVFELGSLICALAHSANVLIVGRAIAGVGCAGLASGTFTIVALVSEPKRRPTLMGILTMVYGIAAVAGPLIGGAFTGSAAGWRWCFWINLPVGAVAAVLTLFSVNVVLPPQGLTWRQKLHRLDLGGVVLLMGGLVAFILALQYAGQTMPWHSATVVGLLVGCAAITAVFTVWQVWLGESALVVCRVLLSSPSVWACSVFQFFFSGSYFIALYNLPIYFQSVFGTSPMGSGVHNLPLVVTMSIGSLLGGLLVTRIGRTGPVLAVGASLASVSCGLFYMLDEHSSAGRWIGFQILAGACWGGAFAAAAVTAQVSQKVQADIPLASSIILLIQTLGGTLGISAAQCAFNNTLIKSAARLLPGIDASLVLTTGATNIRTVFSAEQLPLVIHAYVESLHVVWAFAATMVGTAALLSVLCPWSRILPKTDSALVAGVV